MKKVLFILSGCVFAIVLMYNLCSCNKNVTNAPSVSFIWGVGYVSDDTTLPAHTFFTIYPDAIKNGINDLVESGKIQRSINGGPDSALQTMNFVTSEFAYPYDYITGDSGQILKYVITFGNQNGVMASDSVIITVI